MKKNTLEYRMMQERHRLQVPDSKLSCGSLSGKFPVVLDGGRTTIYIDDESKESETRERYGQRRDNRFIIGMKKPKV